MNILLIAPDMGDLNTIPEIRAISGAHQTHVLNGRVTAQDIYAAVSVRRYDVLHFATHIRENINRLDELLLSDGDTLDLNSATRFARLGGAKLVVFNICLAARFATHMVRNNIPCVLYTTVTILDRTAWELPAAFYEQCRRAELVSKALDFEALFLLVDDGDGSYGIASGAGYYVSIFEERLVPMWAAIHDVQKKLDDSLQAPDDKPTWITIAFLIGVAVVAAGSILTIVEALARIFL